MGKKIIWSPLVMGRSRNVVPDCIDFLFDLSPRKIPFEDEWKDGSLAFDTGIYIAGHYLLGTAFYNSQHTFGIADEFLWAINDRRKAISIVITLNKYLHDFSAAFFLACLVLAWILRRQRQFGEKQTLFLVYLSLRHLFWGSLVVTLMCGGVRAWTYRAYEWNGALGKEQISLLIIKHVVFGVLVIVGAWYWWKTGNFLNNRQNGDEIRKRKDV